MFTKVFVTRIFLAVALTFMVAGTETSAWGALVWQNAPLTGPSPHGLGIAGGFIQAADFTLGGPTTLTGMRFWDDDPLGTSYMPTVTWSIYNDAGTGGRPGALLGRSTASATHVAIAEGRYQNDFDMSAITLPAGNYWVGLHLEDVGVTSFSWTSKASSPTFGPYPSGAVDVAPFDVGSWVFQSNTEPLFELYGNVPEPTIATVAMASLIAGRHRRRR